MTGELIKSIYLEFLATPPVMKPTKPTKKEIRVHLTKWSRESAIRS